MKRPKLTDALKKTAIRLNVRYDIKKEYFTIALPVLVAFLFLAGSIAYMGFLSQPKTTEKETKKFSLSDLGEGQELTDEQIKQLYEAKKESSKKDTGKDKKWDNLDDAVIVAFLIAVIPFSLDLFLTRRRIRRYEEDYSDFLFQMSEMMRGGIDPIKAVIELSKGDTGSITPHVRIATTRMSYGKSFEYSMKKMAESLKSKIIMRYTDLLIHASYTGGNVSEQVQKSSEDMKKFLALEREKEGGLKMYVLIMYMAQGLLLLLAGVFVYNLMPSMQNVNLGMFIKGASGQSMSKTAIMTYIFHIIMINAFFVGIISGKVSTGSVKNGLKHSVLLVVGSYLIAHFMITPQLGGLDNVKIEPLTYPLETNGGKIPPVVFKVTDLKGAPLANATIKFSVMGPGPSKVKRPGDKTDENGLVSAEVTLGLQPGLYMVEAKYNEISTTADIRVKALA